MRAHAPPPAALDTLERTSAQTLPYAHLGKALATDYFFVREQFSDEEWDHFIATRRFVACDVACELADSSLPRGYERVRDRATPPAPDEQQKRAAALQTECGA